MNNNLFKYSIFALALALATCAAFFSIAGLAKLFARASLSVIIMASLIELSKLFITSFLYRNFQKISFALKTYLLIALTIIMTITSIGIYGFLSSAYQETKLNYELTSLQSEKINKKFSQLESGVKNMEMQLQLKKDQLQNLIEIRNTQEQQATQLITQNKSFNSINTKSANIDKQIAVLNQDIDSIYSVIYMYTDSINTLQINFQQESVKNQISSELGSLVFIANITGLKLDTIVNILILLFIIVFDPLAVCLTLVFNYMNTTKPELISKELRSYTGQISKIEDTEYSDTNTDETLVISPDMNVIHESAIPNKKRSTEYTGAVTL